MLAERITEETFNDPPSKGLPSSTRIWGSLSSQHEVDVHERVREHIADPDSRPNDLHRAIVDLALTSERPRIITTNYDRHLSTCLLDRPGEDSSSGGEPWKSGSTCHWSSRCGMTSPGSSICTDR